MATRLVAPLRFADGTTQSTADTGGGTGSSATIGTVEVDFGVQAKWSWTTTVAVAGLVAGRPVVAVQSGDAATGRYADENELDFYTVTARTLAGQLVLNVDALYGSMIQGKSKINYMVG